MNIQLDQRQLGKIISESVRQALRAEIKQLRALVLPNVSKAEQKDIEKRYGKPSREAAKEYSVET